LAPVACNITGLQHRTANQSLAADGSELYFDHAGLADLDRIDKLDRSVSSAGSLEKIHPVGRGRRSIFRGTLLADDNREDPLACRG
jgi:hypothetical protein